jgi:hypothetical protein
MRTAMTILKLLVGAALIIGNLYALGFAMDRLNFNLSRSIQKGYEITVLVTATNLLYVAATFWRLNPKSRIGVLVGLWFDAKERELKERGAGPPEPPHSA